MADIDEQEKQALLTVEQEAAKIMSESANDPIGDVERNQQLINDDNDGEKKDLQAAEIAVVDNAAETTKNTNTDAQEAVFDQELNQIETDLTALSNNFKKKIE